MSNTVPLTVSEAINNVINTYCSIHNGLAFGEWCLFIDKNKEASIVRYLGPDDLSVQCLKDNKVFRVTMASQLLGQMDGKVFGFRKLPGVVSCNKVRVLLPSGYWRESWVLAVFPTTFQAGECVLNCEDYGKTWLWDEDLPKKGQE
jgi:hypothetical protein